MSPALPDFVARLLWDVDPTAIDPARDAALIFERVMSRGSWDAMKWLRATYPRAALADFVTGDGGRRLAPRDRAYWALVCDVPVEVGPGAAPALGRMNGITEAQRDALARLAPWLEPGTYLAGGVAAALVLQHRTSLDLDLFVPAEFDEDGLVERLAAKVQGLRVLGRARGTLHVELGGVPTSILLYRYPTLSPPAGREDIAVPIASEDDLVCMKLSAIAGRGAAKDFWDLDLLLQHGAAGGSLAGALQLFARKYASEDVGHVIRSLAYFADADAAPLPLGLEPVVWAETKRRMAERVRGL